MKTFMHKLFLKELSIANRAGAYTRYILLILSVIGVFSIIAAAQSSTNSGITTALCNVFNTIRNVVFLLGIVLMILGGALYAGANIMPSQSKGGFQGYGMGMIIGGVIGVAIAVAAPYILSLIANANPNGILTSTGSGGVIALCSNTPIP